MANRNSAEVIVLGAGMAGLAAARALAERSVRVLVIEARDRVGGRIHTVKADGAVVELGAEFIHGRAPELIALLEEAQLSTTERDGAMLRTRIGGGLDEDDPQDAAMFAPLESLRPDERGHFALPDLPFTDFLAAQTLKREDSAALLGYVEGFNAADARRIGTHALGAQQAAEDAIDGDRAWHIDTGYAQLTEYLRVRIVELGGRIALGQAAERVEWQPGSVTVTTAAGEAFHAARCIVTLPLGVLQKDRVAFSPEPAALAAARRLAVGHVVRLTLVFRTRWWEHSCASVPDRALRELSFLFTPQQLPSVWWTPHPEPGPPMLTGWVGGPRSAALQGQSPDALAATACRALCAVFGVPDADLRRELVSVHTHDWSADPFALGAYSYVPAGALDAPRAMIAPESGTLFFAGEHTDVTAHWGTVHGALRSGLRAAAQVLGDPAP